MSFKMKTVEGAETFLRDTLWKNLTKEELEAFRRWREDHDIAEGEFEKNMAANCFKSTSKTRRFLGGCFCSPQCLGVQSQAIG
jgi:hypothetical protein